MPRRIIDGEGIWNSDKIAKLPAQFQPEYCNLIPLALADGFFECEPRKVWTRVYAYNRPLITIDFVTQLLAELEKVDLIRRAEYEGKQWGYFMGMEKNGRLPKPSERNRHSCSNVPIAIVSRPSRDTIAIASRHSGVGLDRLGLDAVGRPNPDYTPEEKKQLLAKLDRARKPHGIVQ